MLTLQLRVQRACEADRSADEVSWGKDERLPRPRRQKRREGNRVAQVEGADGGRDSRGTYVEQVSKGAGNGKEGMVEGVRDRVREGGEAAESGGLEVDRGLEG